MTTVYFAYVFLIFVVENIVCHFRIIIVVQAYENIFTKKISQFTVYYKYKQLCPKCGCLVDGSI